MGQFDNILKETNPYYEKWGKGRPSKEKLQKRVLSIAWEKEQREKHPERMPFYSFLSGETKTVIISKVNGKETINYKR